MAMPNLERQWTAADRDELPDDGNRYEVVDGELFVTQAPAWRHQRAVGRLLKILIDYVDRERLGVAMVAPADVVFSERRAVQPDLFVVPLVEGRPPEHFTEVKRLLLAVEVLSPTTARADRVAKRAVYREERVDEYWIIDLDARAVERSTPGEPRPEILAETLEWRPEGATRSLVVDLPFYFSKSLDD